LLFRPPSFRASTRPTSGPAPLLFSAPCAGRPTSLLRTRAGHHCAAPEAARARASARTGRGTQRYQAGCPATPVGRAAHIVEMSRTGTRSTVSWSRSSVTCDQKPSVYGRKISNPSEHLSRDEQHAGCGDPAAGAHAEGHRGAHRRQARDHAPPLALAQHPHRVARRQGRVEAMEWAEDNGTDYIFGIAGNATLDAMGAETANNLRFHHAKAAQPSCGPMRASPIRPAAGHGRARWWRALNVRCTATGMRQDVDIRYVVTSLKGSVHGSGWLAYG
jgi:hypothetical protein